MEQIIKKVLKKIENNGFEAYVVGGYARDLILRKKSYDVDICTNALPKDLIKIFPNCVNNNYGGVNFKLKKFNFDITTYRKETKYEGHKPVEIEYINNLFEDINRRDFKINAVCIDSKSYVIDLVDGLKDIGAKRISTIGDPNERFVEDPLRMLRAIRFMTVLEFNLDEKVEEAIRENKDKILTLSDVRIKEEIDKILVNKNALKGLFVLKELGVLQLINIDYNDIVYVSDHLGMWAQLDFEFNSAFTKEEKNNIINIRKILESKILDVDTLFNYGLYLSMVAGEILGISKVSINKIYKSMSIHQKKDIAITPQEIMSILEIEPSDLISTIINDIISEILHKNIKNNYQSIKKYLLSKKEMWIK